MTEFFIRRPVFTIALTLIMIIVGAVSFTRLSVREFPQMDKPVISIRTNYTGASAKLIENDVTTPIENAVAGVSGIDVIRSQSSEGRSRINVEFKDGYNIDVGLSDIRDKLATVIRHLPDNAEQPIINKNDSDSNASIVVSVTDKKKNALELTDYVTRYVLPLIEQVDGVSNVWLWGERPYAMRIWLDPTKMAARSVTVDDINAVLKQQNINVPAGEILGKNRNYPVIANAGLKSASQFANIIIKDSQGKVTYLKDVARVTIGSAKIDSAFRINGHSGVALGVITSSTANPVFVSQGVYKALKKITPNLPKGMSVHTVYDNARFIKASVHEVYRAIFEALLLVVFIVFLFLGSIRSTLIPIVTIPVCLITVFAALMGFHYSINTITLLALVLAIGLVVDDAIVMLENIYRHIEMGKSVLTAAIDGSKEIIFAIIAMTLTLAAVYLPIAFTQGLTGILFQEFALTLAGAVIISGIVALTLSPMMSARLLSNQHSSKFSQFIDHFFHKLIAKYRRLLSWTLQRRWWVFVLLVVIASIGWHTYSTMPNELAPTEDRGMILGIIDAPTNSSFNYTNKYVKQIEAIYQSIPEATGYLMSVGWPNGNSAFSILSLKPQEQRNKTQQQLSTELKHDFAKVAGVEAFPVRPTPFRHHSSGNRGIEIRIMSAGSYDNLIKLVNKLVTELADYPGLTNINSSLQMDNQQFDIVINRTLAADLGVNINDVSEAIATLLGGKSDSTFEFDGQNYEVMLQMNRKDLQDFSALKKMYVRSTSSTMIPLSSLITVRPEIGPLTLPHFNRLRSDEISADLANDYTVGQVVSYLKQYLNNALPNTAQYEFSGAIKDFTDSQARMRSIFLLALAFIYLVLAAQFESFIDPFIVLLSVPLSLVGGILLLKLAGGTINIYSQIALVTLVGLIAKHGILITEFANQKVNEGKDKLSAVLDASALRLRPIFMTTAAMVLGAIPLAFAAGAGAISRQQVGWVIVGGMTFGTFFSLFVVPAAYMILSRRKVLVTHTA